jgi:hypothetical protein
MHIAGKSIQLGDYEDGFRLLGSSYCCRELRSIIALTALDLAEFPD